MQGNKEYCEKLFLSFQLSQRVPLNNFYRRLKDTLDLRFLAKQTQHYYGTEGQQSIDPVVFFKLMLVGYLENLSSDRQIIEHAAMRMDILFFLGYDIDEQLPWHSTLSRTRKLYGEDVFLSLFQKVLTMCISKGMVNGRKQAIDSAFVKANASMNSLVAKEVVADTRSYLDELTQNEEDKPVVTEQQKKMVDQHHAWKKKAYKGMPGHRAKDKDPNDDSMDRKFLSNHTHYSPTDPDARISVKPGKPRQLNYTGQISVDTQSHVICGAMADHADNRDSMSLPAILTQTIDNLKPHQIKVEEILADTGYSSGDVLRTLEFQKIKGYIPNFGQYKPEREGFTYDPDNNRYICSQGSFLPYKKTYADAKGNVKNHYRASARDCKPCPLRSACIGKSNEKTIEDTIDKPYYDRMHIRMQTQKAKRMKKLRQSTVEPVLGTLINFLSMKRVNTRGLQQANKHVLMAALAYNLKKYMNYVRKIKIPMSMENIKNPINQVVLAILSFFIAKYSINLLNRNFLQISYKLL